MSAYTHSEAYEVPVQQGASASGTHYHPEGSFGRLKQWASHKFGAGQPGWIHVDDDAPGPLTEVSHKGNSCWKRALLCTGVAVVVLCLTAGVTYGVLRVIKSQSKDGSGQRTTRGDGPVVCQAPGSSPPRLQPPGLQSAASSLSSTEDGELRRLMIKFGDDIDPFQTKARALAEKIGGRKLLANESTPMERLVEVWKSGKPMNGWFNQSELLPEALPESIQNLVERFFYCVHSGTFILEMENIRVMKVVKRLVQSFSTLRPGLVENVEEDSYAVLGLQASDLAPRGTNDALLREQYHLKTIGVLSGDRLGQTGSNPGQTMTGAWRFTRGDPEVVVAVIDSGIDLSHPDLVDNLWVNPGEIPDNGEDDDDNGFVDDVHGFNFVAATRTPSGLMWGSPPQDDNGHGTHVAGIIAGTADNGIGITGVAPGVKVMALKTLRSNGSGLISDMIQAVEYSLLMKVPVSCNSYGGNLDFSEFRRIVRKAAESGQLFVAAAGNEGQNNDEVPAYPASYNEATMLAVAATDSSDCLAQFSNFGGRTVHLAAPGVNILSTWPGNDYKSTGGTSQAAPIVAGTAALMLSRLKQVDPSWARQGQRLREVILQTADKLPGMDQWLITGGRINASRAVEVLVNGTGGPSESPAPLGRNGRP